MTDETEIKSAPLPTVRRLPLYLRFLKQVALRGREVVSCTHIAEELKLDPTQIRKDLAVTGIVGRPKVGYLVQDLIDAIEEFLGWKNTRDALLVGAGSLGRALMGYERLRERLGLNIVAAFDSDPEKVGLSVHGREVLPMRKLAPLARRMHIRIGIVTVPGPAAQEVADLMVGAGIRAIWNFSPQALDVPDDVIVESADLAPSLAVLTSRLEAALHHQPVKGGK